MFDFYINLYNNEKEQGDQMKKKRFEEKRKGFRLLLEPRLYDEIMIRARQRFHSMTAYITKAILDRIAYEEKFDK